MHIVQLANFYGPHSGGIRTCVDQLAHHYADAGHRCTLIVPGAGDSVDHGATRTVVTIKSPFVPGLGGYRAITNRSVVRAALRSLQPDVIELSDKTTLVAPAAEARRKGARVVLISHERLDLVVGRAMPLRSWYEPMTRRYNTRLLDRVDAVVCATDFAAAEFSALDATTAHFRVPLGVDLDHFRPASGPRGATLRIVSAVRLSPEKSPDLMIDAARTLHDRGVDFHWDLYGDGPVRGRLEQAAAGLPIEFHGFVNDRDALARAMADADVGVAPGQFETFGLAALEFLAAGTPVVVPDQGALQEMVAPGTGLVGRSDGAEFADAIAELAAGDRAAQRAAARAHAESMSWANTAERMLGVFSATDVLAAA